MFNRRVFRMRNWMFKAIALFYLLWFTMPVAIASPADEDDDWPEWYGLLESRPSGIEGEWVVGSRTFIATSATTIEQEDETLEVGVCTKVTYRVVVSGYEAIEISGEEIQQCNDSDDEDKVTRYARIESMPSSGLIGNWTIGGTPYTADASTRFKQEYGGFTVGACVELEHRRNSTVLTELSTERDYKCSNNNDEEDDEDDSQGDVSYGKLYGIITSFPADLIGEWVIGDMHFVASDTT